MTWKRSVLSNILGDPDVEVLLVEDWHEIVHVRDDNRDSRRRGIRRDLIVDQFGRPDLEGVNAAVLQDPGVLAVERHVGGDQPAHGDITIARHLEIEMASIVVF